MSGYIHYHCTHKQYWRCWVLVDIYTLQVLLFEHILRIFKHLNQDNGFKWEIISLFDIFKEVTKVFKIWEDLGFLPSNGSEI